MTASIYRGSYEIKKERDIMRELSDKASVIAIIIFLLAITIKFD